MAHDKLDIHNFCFQFYLNRFPRWEKLPLIWNKRPCLEHEMYRSLYHGAKCIERRANLLFSFGVINFSSCCTIRILLCAASQRMKWTRKGKKSWEIGAEAISNRSPTISEICKIWMHGQHSHVWIKHTERRTSRILGGFLQLQCDACLVAAGEFDCCTRA